MGQKSKSEQRMWEQPWSFKEGIAIGCVLLCFSLILQFAAGPINWGLTAWPVNVWLLAIFLAALTTMRLLERKIYLFKWLSTLPCAVAALALALLVTIVLGFNAQAPSSAVDAPWLSRLLSSWPFVMAYAWLALSLGLTVLKVASRRWTCRTVPFMLNHLGLLVALVTATLGNADMQRLRMKVGQESMGYGPQAIARNALTPGRESVEMDFFIALKSFEIERYESDSAQSLTKNFTSRIAIYANDKAAPGLAIMADTAVKVNKPLSVNGWKIYQYGYDSSRPENPRYSEFQIVRDPWLPWVYAGIIMMLAGALALLFTSTPKTSEP